MLSEHGQSLINQINSIEGRASTKVCKGQPYDFRRYAEALSESGFSLIYQWCAGNWSAQAISQYYSLIEKAITNGSFPLLSVAAIIAAQSPHLYKGVYQRLTINAQAKLNQLIKIGSGLDRLGPYILLLDQLID